MSVTATELTFTQGTSDKFYRVLRVGAAVTGLGSRRPRTSATPTWRRFEH